MPVTKNQHERLKCIIAMLRLKQYPNHRRFLHNVQQQDPAGAPPSLSRKTFQRDLLCLRDTFGAPIRYDASQKGFYLLDPAWSNDCFLVEPPHLRSTLISQQFVSTLMPEPVREECLQALHTILAHHESGLDPEALLSNLQVFYKNAIPVNPAHFYTVLKAWERRKELEIDYCDASGKSSHKIFEPHLIAWANGAWYLKGIVQDQTPQQRPASHHSVRVLAIHRIQSARETPRHFDDHSPAARNLNKTPLFTFDTIPNVIIRYAPAFARQVHERFATTPQLITRQPDGAAVLALANIPLYEAVEYVLWAKGDATALEPPELISAITTIGQKILQNHPQPQKDANLGH